MQITLVGVIFITNLALTAFAVSQYQSANGVGLIYDDDCDKVKQLDQWIHLLINLLSTGMLSASNYCMQLQAAPTRADVDRAHEAKEWLDIGEQFSGAIMLPLSYIYLSFSRHVPYLIPCPKTAIADSGRRKVSQV
jgi:hypothetical protein